MIAALLLQKMRRVAQLVKPYHCTAGQAQELGSGSGQKSIMAIPGNSSNNCNNDGYSNDNKISHDNSNNSNHNHDQS